MFAICFATIERCEILLSGPLNSKHCPKVFALENETAISANTQQFYIFFEQTVTLTLDWRRQGFVKMWDLRKKYRNNMQTRPLLLCVWFKMVVAFKISAPGTIFFPPLLDAIKQAQGKTLVIHTFALRRGGLTVTASHVSICTSFSFCSAETKSFVSAVETYGDVHSHALYIGHNLFTTPPHSRRHFVCWSKQQTRQPLCLNQN